LSDKPTQQCPSDAEKDCQYKPSGIAAGHQQFSNNSYDQAE